VNRFAAYQERCDTCGKFLLIGSPGSSWSQQWSYDYDGCPDLHDPTYRCSPCTDMRGVKPTNCQGDRYNGRNPNEQPE
jgi:hypothetical protein